MKGFGFQVSSSYSLWDGLWMMAMKGLRKKVFALALVLMLVLTNSCQDELCYNHNHAVPVRLHFSFSPKPETNPKQMNVYFYPTTGGAPLMYQTSGSGVETVMLPIGSYRVMCLNSDTETITYHETNSWDKFHVTASRGGAGQKAETADEEEILYQPENLFVATIAADTTLVDTKNGYDLSLATNNVVYNYNFTIEGVKNLKYVSGMSGSISGLASGYYVCNKAPYNNPCTHCFDASFDAGKNEVYISMMTFGKIENEVTKTLAVPSNLTLDVALVDGSVWEYKFDVSKQLDEKEPDEHLTINILIEDIPIPKPVNPGNSSFNPDVSGWGKGEDISVPM